MYKYIIALLVGFSILLTLSCKKKAKVETQVNSIGTIFGNGNRHYIGEVIQTSNDEYLVCGTVNSGEHGLSDGYLMKMDADFNLLWYRNYGGNRQDNFESMAVDEDGNIMLVGFSYSFGVSTDTNNFQLNNLFYVVYTDASGNIKWQKTYQPNIGSAIPNDRNEAFKVVYLKNKRFCITGITTNFNSNMTLDGYAFQIDNTGKVEWKSNYYNVTQAVSYEDEEYIESASLCDDGNVMLIFKGLDTASSNSNSYLIKVSTAPGGDTVNRALWQGPIIKESSYSIYTFPERPQKLSIHITEGDRTLFGDIIHGELVFTGVGGAVTKRVKFKNTFDNIQIEKSGSNFLVSGTYKINNASYPCWAMTDKDGNILEENYLELASNLKNKIILNALFVNSKNERVGIGTIEEGKDYRMIFMRMNERGKFVE